MGGGGQGVIPNPQSALDKFYVASFLSHRRQEKRTGKGKARNKTPDPHFSDECITFIYQQFSLTENPLFLSPSLLTSTHFSLTFIHFNSLAISTSHFDPSFSFILFRFFSSSNFPSPLHFLIRSYFSILQQSQLLGLFLSCPSI